MPTAAYNVSGEFSMLKAAEEKDLDRRTARYDGNSYVDKKSRRRYYYYVFSC